MPWKNGGGITREIAAFPEGADLADFEWRISMADVASDGPFSRFEGVDRTLCVLEGSIELTLQGGKAVVLDPNSAPLGFPADEDVVARLPGGPVSSGGEAKLEALDCLLFDRGGVSTVHAKGRGNLIIVRIL